MMQSRSSLNLLSGIVRVVTSAPWKCASEFRFLGPSPFFNPIAGQSFWSEGTGGSGWLTVVVLFPCVGNGAVMFEFVKLNCTCMPLSGSAYDVSW